MVNRGGGVLRVFAHFQVGAATNNFIACLIILGRSLRGDFHRKLYLNLFMFMPRTNEKEKKNHNVQSLPRSRYLSLTRSLRILFIVFLAAKTDYYYYSNFIVRIFMLVFLVATQHLNIIFCKHKN